jgi:hypothetical protein
VGNALALSHTSTGALFRSAKAVVAVSDRAEYDRSVADGPAGGVFLKSDWLADQRLVDVNRRVAPADLTAMSYPPHVEPGVIFRLAQAPSKRPGEGV